MENTGELGRAGEIAEERRARLRPLAEGASAPAEMTTISLRATILRRAASTTAMLQRYQPSSRWERRIMNTFETWWSRATYRWRLEFEFLEPQPPTEPPSRASGWGAWFDARIEAARAEMEVAAVVGLRDETLTASVRLVVFLESEILAYVKGNDAFSRARPATGFPSYSLRWFERLSDYPKR